jgi:hypothetical protein
MAMKLRLWFVIATCFVAAGALFVPISSRGQEDVLIQAPSSDSVEHVKVLQRAMAASPFEQRVNVTVQLDPMNQLQQAAAKIRDAESDAAKSAAKEELTALLDRYFEDDMARRVKELAKVEERVNRLRALLEKRKSKKQEIIDLQMKVLENEADGLGFFNSAHAPGKTGWPMLFGPLSATSAGGQGSASDAAPRPRQNTSSFQGAKGTGYSVSSGGASATISAPQQAPSPPSFPATRSSTRSSRSDAPPRQEGSSSGNRSESASSDDGADSVSVPLGEALSPN